MKDPTTLTIKVLKSRTPHSLAQKPYNKALSRSAHASLGRFLVGRSLSLFTALFRRLFFRIWTLSVLLGGFGLGAGNFSCK